MTHEIIDFHDPRNAHKFPAADTPEAEVDGAQRGAIARWFDAPVTAASILACGFGLGASLGAVAILAARDGLPF